MAAITVLHLTRRFTTHVKQPGFTGALRGLIRREYVTKTALDDVSFTIEPGEFVGFLGPNGAGKTTTLKILSGVLHPTSGTAEVLGHVPWQREPALQKRFSLVLGQKNQLWWDLPAYDSFELNRDIYDVPAAVFAAKVRELTEVLDLQNLLHVPVRKLSLGERMKCEIAASLLHAPEVLYLDEPTIGLDVVSQVRIRQFLREYNERTGITVLLTSHYMADIEALCRRVLVIDEGRAIYDGELRDLATRFASQRRIRLTLKRTATELEIARLRAMDDTVEIAGYSLALAAPRDQVPSRVAELLQTLPVEDLSVEEVAIETVVRDLFARGGNENGGNENGDENGSSLAVGDTPEKSQLQSSNEVAAGSFDARP
jgi:ABC-2 type transport system ATP-binding protein